MLIEISDAKKYYGKDEALVKALDGAGFQLDEGKICVILGSSGSGKSTLLNLIGGLDKADSGTVNVNARKLTAMSKNELTDYRREDVGFVFQFYNLIPDLTVRENIEVVRDIAKKPLDIDEVMKSLGICELSGRFPKELSGGQQQRVAIARALIKNPRILLCDELTGALDSKSARTVLKVVMDVNNKYKTTVVIVTHNESIAVLADQVVRIKDGKVSSVVKNDKRGDLEAIEL